ncbi:extensin family protein [Celeribacter sp.]|uniref:extensin-like domain-containing protein n=1 Tax=Celeribacter sp. TaxID=1890673 RepID=UPI003A91AA3B
MRGGVILCAAAVSVVALFRPVPVAAELSRSPIPVLRPGGDIGREIPQPPEAEWVASAPVVTRSPVPRKRPDGLAGQAQAATVVRKVSYGKSGSVCGVDGIRGQAASAIPARIKGCGLDAPVRVTEIAGLKLSPPATLDCPTAKALYTWVEKGAKPAVARMGGGAAGLRIMASYACRTRNNQAGAKVSEHGRGRAVDVGAVLLKNGDRVSVLKDWGKGKKGKALRAMHKAACGPFGTVLGPNANRYHRDHFHFDTARYRSGSYCR